MFAYTTGTVLLALKDGITYLSRKEVLDGFLGNLFATLIGIVVGIPIALAINRKQQRTIESKAEEQRYRDEAERKKKILNLVKTELEFNKNSLIDRQSQEHQTEQRTVLLPPLKDELWRAFSDGGELQWIKDLDLLDKIASAYHQIRTTIFLEQKYFDVIHFPGLTIQRKKYPKDFIMEYLVNTDQGVLQAIDLALSGINQNLH